MKTHEATDDGIKPFSSDKAKLTSVVKHRAYSSDEIQHICHQVVTLGGTVLGIVPNADRDREIDPEWDELKELMRPPYFVYYTKPTNGVVWSSESPPGLLEKIHALSDARRQK